MFRIDGPGATNDNKFTEGDPANGARATVVTDEWLNAVQEEIAKAIEDDGYVLDKLDPGQLSKSIRRRKIYVGSVAELEALSLPVGTSVYLTEVGRAGDFVVKTGEPQSDPQKGIYIVLANGNYAERQIARPILEVEWFGATHDGSADDTVAIQAAVNIAPSLGCSVFAGYSDYVATQITPITGTRFFGGGIYKTTLKQKFSQNADNKLSLIENVENITDIVIAEMTLDGNYAENNANGVYADVINDGAINGIRIANLTGAIYSRIRIKDFYTDGIYISRISGANNQTPKQWQILDCEVQGRRNGITVAQGDGGLIRGGRIYDVTEVSPFTALNMEPFDDTDLKNIEVDGVQIDGCIRGIGVATKAPGNLGFTYGDNVTVKNIKMRNMLGPLGLTVHGVNNVALKDIRIHFAPGAATGTNDSGVVISQSTYCEVSDVLTINSDGFGVRVLDAFVGDVNHVDTLVKISDVRIVNPKKNGIVIGSMFGSVAGNRIRAELVSVDVIPGAATDGTGVSVGIGDLPARDVTMVDVHDRSTGQFANGLKLRYDNTLASPMTVVGGRFWNVFVTDDATDTPRPIKGNINFCNTEVNQLVGGNDPFFGPVVSLVGDAGLGLTLEGESGYVQFLRENDGSGSIPNKSLYFDSSNGKLRFKDATGFVNNLY